MNPSISTLLEDIHNDISFSDDDKKNLEMKCKTFLINEMKSMEQLLEEKMMKFCEKEVDKMKEVKKDRFNENVNKITEQAVRQIATEFELDEEKVLEKNKNNLLQINNFHELCTSEKTKPLINANTLDNSEDEDINEDNKTETKTATKTATKTDNKTETKTEKKVQVKKKLVNKPDTSDKEAYETYLIGLNKCPGIKKDGSFCERPKKYGCFCGFHKKT